VLIGTGISSNLWARVSLVVGKKWHGLGEVGRMHLCLRRNCRGNTKERSLQNGVRTFQH
jgi:hypothetical protein